MSKKILNLYAGIGGNRKLWDDVLDIKVTAVEIDKKIAEIYKDYFPEDEVIVADAHEYLKDHYDEDWDFVWSSTPCPTHSRVRYAFGASNGSCDPVYPDMRLYQEIIFMEHYMDCKYSVENVVPYYDPLIEPEFRSNKNYLWSNFKIDKIEVPTTGVIEVSDRSTEEKNVYELEEHFGFDLSDYSRIDKEKVLKNCVHPELGKHVLECAFDNKQMTLEKANSEVSRDE